jgi:hypothetical protein
VIPAKFPCFDASAWTVVLMNFRTEIAEGCPQILFRASAYATAYVSVYGVPVFLIPWPADSAVNFSDETVGLPQDSSTFLTRDHRELPTPRWKFTGSLALPHVFLCWDCTLSEMPSHAFRMNENGPALMFGYKETQALETSNLRRLSALFPIEL